MSKPIIREFDWGELTDETLQEQMEVYEDIVTNNFAEPEMAVYRQLLEIHRELTLRENR